MGYVKVAKRSSLIPSASGTTMKPSVEKNTLSNIDLTLFLVFVLCGSIPCADSITARLPGPPFQLHGCALETPDSEESLHRWQKNDSWEDYLTYPLSVDHFERSLNSSARGENARRLAAAFGRALEPRLHGQTHKPVNVYVIGSSMTAGVSCKSPCGASGRECAWPAQLQASLAEMCSPRFDNMTTGGCQGFKFYNTANHGLSSGYVSTFGVDSYHDYGNLSETSDIVIVDLAVNDGIASGIDDKSLQRYTEALVRLLWGLPSSPAIIYISTFTGEQAYYRSCRGCSVPKANAKLRSSLGVQGDGPCAGLGAQDAYHLVTSYYGVPLISFRDVATSVDGSCLESIGGGFSHPPWRVHQLVADTVVHFFVTTMAHTHELSTRSLVKYVLPPSIFPFDDLMGTTLCTVRMARSNVLETRPVLSRLSPKSSVLSQGLVNGTNVRVLNSRSWNCHDDRVSTQNRTAEGRPGWISEVPGSSIDVEFETSDAGAVGLSYLKSYEGVCGAKITIDGKSYSIWRELGQASSKSRGGAKLLKRRSLPSDPDTASPGIVNALWHNPYSLPAMWIVRRLHPGRHVLSVEVLHESCLALKNRSLYSEGCNDVKKTVPRLKFKILGLVSC